MLRFKNVLILYNKVDNLQEAVYIKLHDSWKDFALTKLEKSLSVHPKPITFPLEYFTELCDFMAFKNDRQVHNSFTYKSISSAKYVVLTFLIVLFLEKNNKGRELRARSKNRIKKRKSIQIGIRRNTILYNITHCVAITRGSLYVFSLFELSESAFPSKYIYFWWLQYNIHVFVVVGSSKMVDVMDLMGNCAAWAPVKWTEERKVK